MTRSTHRGFTIVELIIVMIILAALLAFAGRVIVDSLGSANRSASNQSSSERLEGTRQQFISDVRATSTPDGDGLTTKQLASYIGPESLTTPPPDTTHDFDAVLSAQPNLLKLRADVAESGSTGATLTTEDTIECVTWYVDNQGWLVRQVEAGGGTGTTANWRAGGSADLGATAPGITAPPACRGRLLTRERMAQVANASTVPPEGVFHYVLLGAPTSGCVGPRYAYPDNSTVSATAIGQPIRRIASIGLILESRSGDTSTATSVSGRDVTAGSRGLVIGEIRSRATSSYLGAMRCP